MTVVEGNDGFFGFYSRSRRGSDDITEWGTRMSENGFDPTLPQGERPERSIFSPPLFALVSIHAPAGGATRRSMKKLAIQQRVSIHAPAGGATSRRAVSSKESYWFLSTLPQGERRERENVTSGHLAVSIHAPAGGARSAKLAHDPRQICVSIHAPAGGATSTPRKARLR